MAEQLNAIRWRTRCRNSWQILRRATCLFATKIKREYAMRLEQAKETTEVISDLWVEVPFRLFHPAIRWIR